MRFSLLVLLTVGAGSSNAQPDLFKAATSLYDGIRVETLPNGLKVYLKPIPGSPVVTTMVAYKVGSADEELDQTGLSHYLEHLMFKGTEKLFPGDIDRSTQRNGGANNAYTSEDLTVYHFDFAADRWLTALSIEADRMRNIRIDARHEFQQEKGAVIQELNRNEDRPWDLEYKKLLPILFGAKAPYGHPVIGERNHVEGATAEIIKRHYDRWYHPNNAALVVVGGFDEKEALEQITKLFGPIPKSELPERKPVPKLEPRKQTIHEKMTSKFETPKLLMGFNTVTVGDPDEYAFDVLSSILSTGRTSRLYRKLVEGEKLAVAVETSNQAGRYPGWFSVSVELLKDLKKAEGLITAELEALAKDGVTDAELQRAKRNILANYIFSHESVHSLANSIATAVANSGLDYVKTYLPRIAAITNDDLKRVAKKYFVDAKGVVLYSIPGERPKGSSLVPDRTSPLQNSRMLSRQLAKEISPSASGGFVLKDSKTVTLPNGMRLLLLENHRLPMVVAEVQIERVRLHEPADKLGVATLMGMLLEDGTAKHKSEEIAQLIEDTGGNLSLSSTGGSLKVLTPDLDIGLDLLFDCLMNPSFPADEFETKRAQLISEIGETEKQPNARARLEFMKLAYGKHPYGRPALGTIDDVKKLTRKDCQTFHAENFVPGAARMALVGDFDSEKVIAAIKKRTEAWKAGQTKFAPPPKPTMPEKFTEEIISDPEAAQVHLYMGHIGIARTNPDYYKLLVMDNVLGTGPGFTDRLSSTLRDRQGLAYTVNATIATNAGQEPGVFEGYIGAEAKNFTWVRDGFLKEIRRIRDETPAKQEVDDAKKYLTGSLPFRLTSAEMVASMLLSIDRYQLGLNYLDDYRKAISEVTPEDVQAVAKKYLNPDKLIIVAVGALDKEGKPLKK
jgi:zinc protease